MSCWSLDCRAWCVVYAVFECTIRVQLIHQLYMCILSFLCAYSRTAVVIVHVVLHTHVLRVLTSSTY